MSQKSGEKLLISCREATYLISRNREKPIGLRARLKLLVHLIICEYCRRFMRQTRTIEIHARKLQSDGALTGEEKKEMEEKLESSRRGL